MSDEDGYVPNSNVTLTELTNVQFTPTGNNAINTYSTRRILHTPFLNDDGNRWNDTDNVHQNSNVVHKNRCSDEEVKFEFQYHHCSTGTVFFVFSSLWF